MHSRSAGDTLAFVETSAIINYAKVDVYSSLYPQRIPNRAAIIRNFLQHAIRNQWKLKTSKKVIGQLAFHRDMIEKELLMKKIPPAKVLKLVEVATKAIRGFLEKNVETKDVDGSDLFVKVNGFFERYKEDQRMLDVADMKEEKKGGITSSLPEQSDMRIFADALMIPSEYFITTDNHFCLEAELKAEFNIVIISHLNANRKMEDFGWDG